jgi:hypothetical protein
MAGTCAGFVPRRIRRQVGAFPGFNEWRRIGHSEEDHDLPTWFALESATMFRHGLIAVRAPRYHGDMGTPKTAESSAGLTVRSGYGIDGADYFA